MNGALRIAVCGWIALFAAGHAGAQSSAQYRAEESVLNSGGRPAAGQTATSVSYRISLDSIGSAVGAQTIAGASYAVGGGFVTRYPAPLAIDGVRWNSGTGLAWNPNPAAGTYRVYRGPVHGVSSASATCLGSGLVAASYAEAAEPAAGAGYFYLVAVANAVFEEGPLGSASGGAPRTAAAVCP